MTELIIAILGVVGLVLKLWHSRRSGSARSKLNEAIEKAIEKRRQQSDHDKMVGDYLRGERVDRLLREARRRLGTKRGGGESDA